MTLLRLLPLFLLPAVTLAQSAPVAVDDFYTTPVDDNLSQDDPGVLENDSDVDGDALIAELVGPATGNGALFLFPDGSFEYEPGSLGLDTFSYRAFDGTDSSNVATITFDVTPGQGAVTYVDEAAYHQDLVTQGYQRFQESFEDDAVWGASRTNAVPSVTHQGVTWSSNYPQNGIRTGSGPAFAGNYGFFSLPHGDYLAGPQCLDPGVCTDGWRGTSVQKFFAIGGLVDGTGAGAKVSIILDDDPARTYDLGFAASPRFFGLMDPAGFNTFEFREQEGTSTDAFLLFADHFTFAFLDGLAPEPLVFGCGPNPVGSMSVLAGSPTLGTTITFGIDNPLGTQPAGSATLLVLSRASIGAFPCGIPIGGWGMNWPGYAPGELLINTLPPFILPLVPGPNLAGQGVPTPIPVPIPDAPALANLVVYAQAAIIDPPMFSANITLTEAVQMVLAP